MIDDPLFFERMDLRPKRQVEKYEEDFSLTDCASPEPPEGTFGVIRDGKLYWEPIPIYQPGPRNIAISWLWAASQIHGDFFFRRSVLSRSDVGGAMWDDPQFFAVTIPEIYPRIAYVRPWCQGDLLWLGLKADRDLPGSPYTVVHNAKYEIDN